MTDVPEAGEDLFPEPSEDIVAALQLAWRLFEVHRQDRHTTIIDSLYHASDEERPVLRRSGSRWGHGGVYFSSPAALRNSVGGHMVKVAPPDGFRLYEVRDAEMGSAHLWRGFGADEDWKRLLFRAAKKVGLPLEPGLGWSGKSGCSWWNYARELQKVLREELEGQGYDGIWIGGEMVVWNYDKLRPEDQSVLSLPWF